MVDFQLASWRTFRKPLTLEFKKSTVELFQNNRLLKMLGIEYAPPSASH